MIQSHDRLDVNRHIHSFLEHLRATRVVTIGVVKGHCFLFPR